MKRTIIVSAAGLVLLVAGVGIGLSLASGAGSADAQSSGNGTQATGTPGACGGNMWSHMQQMHDGDDIQAMRQHMDAMHGAGSFDRMLQGGCPYGTPIASGTPGASFGPGGMMGGYGPGGMMGGFGY